MRKRTAIAALVAAMLAGGAIGLTVFGPSVSGAQTTPTTTAATAPPAKGDGHRFGGPRRGPGAEGAVAAKAIGITEADLRTALESGKSLAQVARDHKVDP